MVKEVKMFTIVCTWGCEKSFIERAKWEQERSYSEEEVLFFIKEALYDTNMRYDRISAEEWFEQFKK